MKNQVLVFHRIQGDLYKQNNSPNSSFGVRPAVLLAQKECLENVLFLMENIIQLY